MPFGEYVPFADLLNRIGITKLTEGQGGFSAGDGPHIYHVPGAPDVTPLICYEIIFPGAVTARQRPGWLVNVTDDSWFGPWAGPLQHLLIARVRAIEEGAARRACRQYRHLRDDRSLGRITASLDLGHMGVVDAPLAGGAGAHTLCAFWRSGLSAFFWSPRRLRAFVLARKVSR